MQLCSEVLFTGSSCKKLTIYEIQTGLDCTATVVRHFASNLWEYIMKRSFNGKDMYIVRHPFTGSTCLDCESMDITMVVKMAAPAVDR